MKEIPRFLVCLCFLLATALNQALADHGGYCPLGVESPSWRFFGTKTAYRSVRGDVNATNVDIEGCTPDKMIAVIRHGNRYPGDDDIFEFYGLLAKIQRHIVNVTGLETLHNFSFTLEPENDKKLTESGKDQLKGQAERLEFFFPGLLNATYSPEFYRFRHTHKTRTRDSARAFIQQLFGSQANGVVMTTGGKDDFLLRPYKECDVLEDRDDAKLEEKTFQATHAFQDMVERVNCRLNHTGLLTPDEVVLLAEQCFYDLLINPTRGSPLCLPFTEEDFKIFQYFDDLEKYYLSSYDNIPYPSGFNLATKVYCPLYGEVLNLLTNSSTQTTTVFFGHSETLIPFFTGLGYNYRLNNKPPKFEEYDQTYTQKTSNSAPMAGNAILVRYNCRNNKQDIRLFINEEDVTKVTQATEGGYDGLIDALKRLSDCTGLEEGCRRKSQGESTQPDHGNITYFSTCLLITSLLLTTFHFF